MSNLNLLETEVKCVQQAKIIVNLIKDYNENTKSHLKDIFAKAESNRMRHKQKGMNGQMKQAQKPLMDSQDAAESEEEDSIQQIGDQMMDIEQEEQKVQVEIQDYNSEEQMSLRHAQSLIDASDPSDGKMLSNLMKQNRKTTKSIQDYSRLLNLVSKESVNVLYRHASKSVHQAFEMSQEDESSVMQHDQQYHSSMYHQEKIWHAEEDIHESAGLDESSGSNINLGIVIESDFSNQHVSSYRREICKWKENQQLRIDNVNQPHKGMASLMVANCNQNSESNSKAKESIIELSSYQQQSEDQKDEVVVSQIKSYKFSRYKGLFNFDDKYH